MNKLLLLTKKLLLSFSSTEFYSGIWELTLREGLLFFGFWMVTIGILSSAYFAFITLPPLQEQVVESIIDTPEYFPEETQVFLSNGSLYTEPELIEIPMPESWLSTKAIDTAATPQLLAVLTRTSLTPQEWEQSNNMTVLLFINNSSAFLNSFSESSTWTEFSLDELVENTAILINKDNIAGKSLETAKLVKQYFPWIQYGIVAFLSMIHLLTRVTIALLESVFLFLILRMFDKKVSFLSTLNFSLILLVPSEIINQIAIITWPNSPVSFLTVSFWLMAIYILTTTRQDIQTKTN